MMAWNAGSDAIVLNGGYWLSLSEFHRVVLECALHEQPGPALSRPARRESRRCRTTRRTGPAGGPRAPSAPRERPPHVRPQRRRSPGRPRPLNCVPVAGRAAISSSRIASAGRPIATRVTPISNWTRLFGRAHLQRPAQFSDRTVVLARGSTRGADGHLCVHREWIEFASALRRGDSLLEASTPDQ